MLADGSVLSCSADSHPDVFRAARVGLGALGVISTVTLQTEPAFALHAEESGAELADVLATRGLQEAIAASGSSLRH